MKKGSKVDSMIGIGYTNTFAQIIAKAHKKLYFNLKMMRF